jgi:hypothetical protein
MEPKVPKPSPPPTIDRSFHSFEPIRRERLRPARLHHYIGAVFIVALAGAKAGIFRLAEFAGNSPFGGISIFVILWIPAAVLGAAVMLLQVFRDRYWYR